MKDRAPFIFTVYRCYDPLLWECNDASAMGTYAIERDASKLVMPEDGRPPAFRCRSLSRDQRDRVDEINSANGKRKQAFRYGFLSVEGGERPDGGPISYEAPRAQPKDPLSPPMMDRLEDLGFGDRDFWEIGAAIMAQSFLAQGVPRNCDLPESSVRACVQVRSLIAERRTDSLIEEGESSSAPPSNAAPVPSADPTS